MAKGSSIDVLATSLLACWTMLTELIKTLTNVGGLQAAIGSVAYWAARGSPR